MADSEPKKCYPKGLLWLKLHGWAEDIPENVIHHMLEETAQRCNLDLKRTYRVSVEHYDWECPHIGSTPFGPGEKDFMCSVCGVVGEQFGNYCPKLKGLDPETGFRECRVCKREEDSKHWTEDCHVLGGRMFCWICDMVGEHSTEDCPNASPETEEFCICCESKGHSDENCPKETNDGREYCSCCDLMGDHSTAN